MNNQVGLYCQVCNRLFFARSIAKFCSAKCRKRASRAGVRGNGSDYELTRKSALLLSDNKKRALIMMLIEELDDAHRRKFYDAITEDFFRIRLERPHM